MRRVQVGDRRVAVGIRADARQRPVRERQVLLARKHQRAGQERLGVDVLAAVDHDRPADQIEAVVHRREDER